MSTFTSEPGTRLGGRYRLEDRLAAAGGWSAWKAIDEILARPVSVITFAAGFPRLEQVVTAARAASRLTDTRLTQVFDVEDSWDHGYIVLEWPVGDTLGDLLATGSMEPLAAARIVAEVAAALSGAHAAGLAHLCLRPDAVRWTAGGGIKVTGLGIDAALTGTSADDPELADTRGLGQLLYAALTGLWPGPDDSGLPPAPESDGRPRRPRQVRAGVPTVLDDVAGRALALPGRDGQAAFESPAELAAALTVAIPPLQVPLAAITAVRPARKESDRLTHPQRASGPGTRTVPSPVRLAQPDRRRNTGRAVAVSLLVLVAVAGASAAAVHLLHKSPAGAAARRSSSSSTTPSASSAIVTPASASGFDALNPADTGNENSADAGNVLNGNSAGWATQQYYRSPYFGNLKKGTGLILDLGKPVKVSSITVQFGSVPGADVQIKMGDSNARSAANVTSMTTVATQADVSGSYTFTIRHPVTDQYLVIWFTKLPPMAQGGNKYMAQVFGVVIHGAS
jgi:serine/threonine protein kinase